MAVYLIGTLDTKGHEVAFVKARLQAEGKDVVVVDAGCTGEPAVEADVDRADVFLAAGVTLQAVQQRGDRGYAVSLAAEGVRNLICDAADRGQVDGILALGGSAGTTIGTAAMRALPLEVPKVMVSTMASGQTRPYIGGRNILMLNSVVDIAGINRISRTVLRQAAAAMLGMLDHFGVGPVDISGLVAGIFVIGIVPSIFLDRMEPAAEHFIQDFRARQAAQANTEEPRLTALEAPTDATVAMPSAQADTPCGSAPTSGRPTRGLARPGAIRSPPIHRPALAAGR